MTTGELLVVRAAMKPLATLNRPTLEDRRHRHQGGDGVASRSAPTSPRCRPWAWSPRRWWRSCWPARRTRKFGGDSRRRARAQRRRLPSPLLMSCRRSRHLVLVGMMGVGKTTVGRIARRAARPAVPRQRRGGRGAHRPHGAGDLRDRRRGRVPRRSRPRRCSRLLARRTSRR